MDNSNLARYLSEHPFWKFSVKIYGLKSVESALLELQNHHDLNINIILYCCWNAFRGQGRLGKTEIKQLLTSIQLWHERIVLPLRRLRQNLKDHLHLNWSETVYKEILHQELAAEQIEQNMLGDVFVYQTKPIRTTLQKIGDSCKNIATYCQLIPVRLESKDCENVTEILSPIFPKIDRNEILKQSKDMLISNETPKKTFLKTQITLDL